MIGDYINNKMYRNNYQFRVNVHQDALIYYYYAVCEIFLMLLHKVFFDQRIFLYKIFKFFFQ